MLFIDRPFGQLIVTQSTLRQNKRLIGYCCNDLGEDDLNHENYSKRTQ